MTELLFAAGLTVLVIVAGGGYLAYDRRAWVRRRTGRRIVVHTAVGASIEGTLEVAARDGLILRAARHLDENVELGGECFIPREQVSFCQTREETS